MPYSKMLLKFLQKKNLTDRDVVDRCEKYGVKITEAYFNKIKNGKKNPPREEISRAIAKACDIDERLLVIEGYIDKSPSIIQEVFKSINFMAMSATTKLLKLIKKGNMKEIQKYLDEQPISDIAIEILDGKEKYIDFLENNYTFERLGNGLALSMALKEPIGFEITDDAMAPILNKGDKVGIEINTTGFCSTDILLVQHKGKIYARHIQKLNGKFVLVPLCKPFKDIICNKEDIKILGKINTVLKKI